MKPAVSSPCASPTKIESTNGRRTQWPFNVWSISTSGTFIVHVLDFTFFTFILLSEKNQQQHTVNDFKWLSGTTTTTTTILQPFFLDYPGDLVPEENLLVDFYGAREDNRGRDINHPDGRHSIRTNQRPTSNTPNFSMPHALSAATSHFILARDMHQIRRFKWHSRVQSIKENQSVSAAPVSYNEHIKVTC